MKKYITLVFVCSLFIIGCSNDDGESNSSFPDNNDPSQPDLNGDGQGGSLAVFALVDNFLYTVDNQKLNIYNIEDEKNPILANNVEVGFGVATIFRFDDYLYLGSREGIFVYNILQPEFPRILGEVSNFDVCNTVIADDRYAYVTSNSDDYCGIGEDNLVIYEIDGTNVRNPLRVSSRNLLNPRGMGLYENYLFVCDDEIKIFDISEPLDSKLVASIANYAFDVIIRGENVIAIGDAGLYQFTIDFSDSDDLKIEENGVIAI